MSKAGAVMAARILSELKDLSVLVNRAVQGLDIEGLVVRLNTVLSKTEIYIMGFAKFLQSVD